MVYAMREEEEEKKNNWGFRRRTRFEIYYLSKCYIAYLCVYVEWLVDMLYCCYAIAYASTEFWSHLIRLIPCNHTHVGMMPM